jgi:hypothetical protein
VLLQSRYTPCKGKSIAFQILIIAFALTGRKPKHSSTQGNALGWVLIGLSGRWSATFGSDRYFSKLYQTPIKTNEFAHRLRWQTHLFQSYRK